MECLRIDGLDDGLGDTLQKREILSLTSCSSGISVRQRMMPGLIPISRSFAMLCCVGLVFSSPAALM